MTSDYEPRVPEGVDVSRPSVARIYDYLLFGKDNFAVDREAAHKLMESRLDPRRHALANRGFLVRAVQFLADAGIDQFLDLGSGLPTSPSVHEVARDGHPDARVVYLDIDRSKPGCAHTAAQELRERTHKARTGERSTLGESLTRQAWRRIR